MGSTTRELQRLKRSRSAPEVFRPGDSGAVSCEGGERCGSGCTRPGRMRKEAREDAQG
jgi:hypothetical protein